MLSKLLVRKFVKNYDNVKDHAVRDSYGFLAGMTGIIINFTLFIVKLLVGIISKSISVTADAFNNLSDAASSVITIAGFKIASRPADEEHPFGHGRIEYLSGLVVSFMVMLVGFQFVKSSFSRIMNPEKVVFQLIPFILLLMSIGAKAWLSLFNKHMGNAINSSALKASSVDALGDVFTSSCVAFSLLLSRWISFPIDGYIGIVVSLFIIYSGFSLIKDTIDPLLGQAPDPLLVRDIIDEVSSYEYISGVHDLIVHNYGPGRIMASIHAEVPCDQPIVKLHEVIDRAEVEVSSRHKLHLVIHMDPVNTDDQEVSDASHELKKILENYPMVKSFHDLRIVGEGDNKNLIFDLVIDYSTKVTRAFEKELKNNISKDVHKLHNGYNTVITLDRDFNPID